MRIAINLNDYHEPTTAPVAKYNLVITQCEETVTRNQKKPQFRISIGFEDHPEYQNMLHFIGLPSDNDEPDAIRFKAVLLKRFLSLFKVPIPNDGINTEQLCMQMVGARANAEVALEKEKDESGMEKADGRIFNRIVVPRLKEEQRR